MHNKPEGFELPACGLAVVDHRGCKPPIALCGLPWTQAGWFYASVGPSWTASAPRNGGGTGAVSPPKQQLDQIDGSIQHRRRKRRIS